MKKRSICRLTGAKIIFLTIILSGAVSLAGDWYDLHSMSKSELLEKIEEIKKKLKQGPDDCEALKTLGIAYHIMATKDTQTYAPLAVKTLSKAYEGNEADHVTLCYLGSATTLMATTTNNPSQMGSYVNHGIALMDKAVRKAPDNITVRLTRAYNSKHLPDFLSRRSLAVEDFECLAEMIRKEPLFPTPVKRIVYLNLVELYDIEGNKEKAEDYRKLANGL